MEQSTDTFVFFQFREDTVSLPHFPNFSNNLRGLVAVDANLATNLWIWGAALEVLIVGKLP